MSNSGRWWYKPKTVKYWAIISALSLNLLIWYKMMKWSWAVVRIKEVNLRSIVFFCSPHSTDIKERFTNCILLLIVCLRNMEQFSWNPGNSQSTAGCCCVVDNVHVNTVLLHLQTTCGCCSLMSWWCWLQRWQWILSSTPSSPSSMTSVLMWVFSAPTPKRYAFVRFIKDSWDGSVLDACLDKLKILLKFVNFNCFLHCFVVKHHIKIRAMMDRIYMVLLNEVMRFTLHLFFIHTTLTDVLTVFGQLSFLVLQPTFSHFPRRVFEVFGVISRSLPVLT